MFEEASKTYKSCAHASMGQCHHYSTACEPADDCMYELASKTYKNCAHSSMGQCHHYSSTCEPK